MKKKLLVIIPLLLVIIVAISLSLRTANTMNYTIQLSTLPQNELWTIEHAEIELAKAFNIGIPNVKDEQALLELVKHAYQWDKNAMLQYAKIVENERDIPPDYNASLAAFLRKHSAELVDKNGKPLNTPTILDLPYRELVEKLADKGYPTPASYMSSWLMGSGGEIDGIFKPLPDEKYQKFIKYIEYSMQGGYRDYVYLANTILFKTGYSFKDNNNTSLFKFTDIDKQKVTEEEQKEAIDNYRVCAIHGSLYCLMRLAEANYYGIGIKEDNQTALAWAELSEKAYQHYLQLTDSNISHNMAMKNINNYNMELTKQIKGSLTPEQLAENKSLIEQFEKNIITWDYEAWQDEREPIPPKP